MPKIRVFADTNVILESFRTGCWTAISKHFAIETVEKCVEETLTGNPGDPRHVAVPPADLAAGLAGQHPVTRKELATLVLGHLPSSTLDDGEKHLFAWLFANELLPSHAIAVTTADKAALVALNGLGWLDCMSSLEDLARKAGVGRVTLDALALQYREDWLSSVKTKIRLGIIP
ncbi:hypothetical protein D8B24_12955 [Verminephrobacter aporrectodeae subsp. tuberculatae]|uniref:hypothetical protein n=1 Tax=Verminephrobacter aporrectodeae TaxID=1110389 RepID=UPI0022449055|nr:hypothetical protein [Verminephrobacter aporrectodeae]MCW8207936.1 hypothetical protein [Verminephrobacter aporrectodeae subsp. tuberculatae]